MAAPKHDPRKWATRGPLERHPDVGAQPLEVRHMCPDCAGRGGLCGVCLGVGTVDTDRLERHNRELWAEANTNTLGRPRVLRVEPI
jgi:hypothetical protein